MGCFRLARRQDASPGKTKASLRRTGASFDPMQLLADYFPLLLFFIAFKWQGIYFATAVAMIASVAQIAWFKWKGKLSAIHWMSFAIIAVFGGATLWLKDDVFIRWKPSVLYGLFAAILVVGKLAFRRDLIGALLKDITLPPAVWSRVTWSWAAFLLSMAVLNWYVAFHFPLETWVNFKVWGGIGLFLAFALAQGLMLARHMEQPQQ
jgi:intracellular septation protein